MNKVTIRSSTLTIGPSPVAVAPDFHIEVTDDWSRFCPWCSFPRLKTGLIVHDEDCEFQERQS